jgi:centractin
MPHSILRNDVAGRDVTRYLKLLLRKEGYTFKTTAEFEIVKSIKERVCFLSPTAQKDETSQGDKSQFTLPDGTSIEVWIHSINSFSILKNDFSLEQADIVHRKYFSIRN